MLLLILILWQRSRSTQGVSVDIFLTLPKETDLPPILSSKSATHPISWTCSNQIILSMLTVETSTNQSYPHILNKSRLAHIFCSPLVTLQLAITSIPHVTFICHQCASFSMKYLNSWTPFLRQLFLSQVSELTANGIGPEHQLVQTSHF